MLRWRKSGNDVTPTGTLGLRAPAVIWQQCKPDNRGQSPSGQLHLISSFQLVVDPLVSNSFRLSFTSLPFFLFFISIFTHLSPLRILSLWLLRESRRPPLHACLVRPRLRRSRSGPSHPRSASPSTTRRSNCWALHKPRRMALPGGFVRVLELGIWPLVRL